jgi:hypothetical protein
MTKTAIIYDVIRDHSVFRGTFIIDLYKPMRKYLFNVQYPDNTEEEIEYGDCRKGEYNYEKPNPLVREKCLQRIVNKLENDGYKVYPDQLALFMKNKIDKLIMQKK